MSTRSRDLPRSRLSAKPPRANSRRRLIAELDRLTSIIVRRRGQPCLTYGSRRSLLCSHFPSRRHIPMRLDLGNRKVICPECNHRHIEDTEPELRVSMASLTTAPAWPVTAPRMDARG